MNGWAWIASAPFLQRAAIINKTPGRHRETEFRIPDGVLGGKKTPGDGVPDSRQGAGHQNQETRRRSSDFGPEGLEIGLLWGSLVHF
jgi:hypothetical protein